MALLSRNNNIILISIVTIITVIICIFGLSLDALYDHDSHLFEFGPSSELIFLGIVIDTWLKYSFLVLFMWLLEFMDILQEEYLSPFVHMIHDANVKENQKDLNAYTWHDMYIINHFSLASNGLRQILRVVIVTIQIPLAIVVWLLKELSRIYFIIDVTNNYFRQNNREGELVKGGRKRRFFR